MFAENKEIHTCTQEYLTRYFFEHSYQVFREWIMTKDLKNVIPFYLPYPSYILYFGHRKTTLAKTDNKYTIENR
jgi:hypothetical protein